MLYGVGIGEVVLLLWLGLFVGTLVSLVHGEPSWGILQLLWLAIIVLAPGIGPILYLLVRRPQRQRERASAV
jgi:hypothetical protein